MSERSSPPDEAADEYAVLEYLAAIETRRATASTFPQPDRIVDGLASSEMSPSPDDPEALHRDLGAHAPGSEQNLERLEEGFVAGAKEYGRRHGMGYEAWLRAGVDAAVLRRAGIEPEPN